MLVEQLFHSLTARPGATYSEQSERVGEIIVAGLRDLGDRAHQKTRPRRFDGRRHSKGQIFRIELK
jgi:hypothetical protein